MARKRASLRDRRGRRRRPKTLQRSSFKALPIAVFLLIASCHGESASLKLANAVGTAGVTARGPSTNDRSVDAGSDAGVKGDIAESQRETLAIAPIVDPGRASLAIKGYLHFLSRFCQSIADAGNQASKLEEAVGLPDNTDAELLCPGVPAAVKALASGSFFEPKADEVLLDVPSGLDRAAGEDILALMRADGTGYRLIRHMLAGNPLEATLRLSVPASLDVLMLCRHSGNMGVYPSICGFLGEGTFREGAAPDDGASAQNEIPLLVVTRCGPAVSVQLGKITLQGGRLSVGLVVEESRLEPTGPDEASDRSVCSKATQRHERRFTVPFEVDATSTTSLDHARVRRMTPIPREVASILSRY